MEKPQTIHDFYGFPKKLFNVEYPASGYPQLANETKKLIHKTAVEFDNKWGLDHGCWSVLKHLYPEADVPVIQLSIDHYKTPQWHFELAKEISKLREKGILILGSGNMVHNLRLLNWNDPDYKYDWAEEMNEKFKSFIDEANFKNLIDYNSLGNAASLAVPTPEHFIPLLYILGLKEEKEKVNYFNDRTIMGSISMTSLKISQ
jgi:4,5-DOPA dioxygenase extradiol